MSLLNPQGINGPTQPNPYQQPDYRNPVVTTQVASSPVGSDEMNLSQPIQKYVQPGIGNFGF
jgi:hypothetical protein